MNVPNRRAMVERPGKDLSVRRQCALLNLARSGVYRPKRVAGVDDLALMRRIDELHLELPFYGSRRMTFELNNKGRGVNRKRVQRLMRVMGIEALVPRPGTSKAAPGHKIYPYLLRGVAIAESNHVWAADITYIPMARGFLYLVAIPRMLLHSLGLGQPRGSGLAAVEHDRRRLLRRGSGGGFASAREAEDFQHGSRCAIHQRRVHR
jgi:putative transposase